MINIKVLNFTAVEVLPALLSKAKTQTIRPAWDDKKICSRHVQHIRGCNNCEEKSARFKVGDEVKLLWNQRSKSYLFCKDCGSPLGQCKCPNKYTKVEAEYFNKHLGNGVITEVFKIEMWTGNDVPLVSGYSRKQTEELAKLDGFETFKDFFEYFNLHYDLGEAKQFWVYRWKWLR